MVDTYNAGGYTFDSDDVGGSHKPRVKVQWGADGAASDTSTAAPLPVQDIKTTGVGYTPYSLVSAATTNATNVKASAGVVASITVTNTNASVRYFKLYNKATSPTVGTDTPVQRIAIPGATTGGGVVIPGPFTFSTGISFALTTGAADSDTGAVAANEILVNFGYV